MALLNDARNYLQQAYYINALIDCKLEQVTALRAIATKATSTMHTTPGGKYSNDSMADVIAKIVDLEAEINADIDKLVDLKRDIGAKINAVESPMHRLVLDKRYLCFKSWEQIAVDMGYTIRRVYQLHDEAAQRIKLQ
jgi:hypothetical protein